MLTVACCLVRAKTTEGQFTAEIDMAEDLHNKAGPGKASGKSGYEVDRMWRKWREELVQERLQVYKEQLAEWLGELMNVAMTAESFIMDISTGVYLVRLANMITKGEAEWRYETTNTLVQLKTLKEQAAQEKSFKARDNIAQFLGWAKSLGVDEAVMFETSDLVEKHGIKNVLYCLMEITRCQHALPPPILIQMERDIQRALAGEPATPLLDKEGNDFEDIEETDYAIRKFLRSAGYDASLVEQKDDLGRYYLGQKEPIFVKKMNEHLMVRLGDEWLTLKHYMRVAEAQQSLEADRDRSNEKASSMEKQLKEFRRLLDKEKDAVSQAYEMHDKEVQLLKSEHETQLKKEKEHARARLQSAIEELQQAKAESDHLKREKEDEENLHNERLASLEEKLLAAQRRGDEREHELQLELDQEHIEFEKKQRAAQAEAETSRARLASLGDAVKSAKAEAQALGTSLEEANNNLRNVRKKIAKQRFERAASKVLANNRFAALSREQKEAVKSGLQKNTEAKAKMERLQSELDYEHKQHKDAETKAMELLVAVNEQKKTAEELSNQLLEAHNLVQDMAKLQNELSKRDGKIQKQADKITELVQLNEKEAVALQLTKKEQAAQEAKMKRDRAEMVDVLKSGQQKQAELSVALKQRDELIKRLKAQQDSQKSVLRAERDEVEALQSQVSQLTRLIDEKGQDVSAVEKLRFLDEREVKLREREAEILKFKEEAEDARREVLVLKQSMAETTETPAEQVQKSSWPAASNMDAQSDGIFLKAGSDVADTSRVEFMETERRIKNRIRLFDEETQRLRREAEMGNQGRSGVTIVRNHDHRVNVSRHKHGCHHSNHCYHSHNHSHHSHGCYGCCGSCQGCMNECLCSGNTICHCAASVGVRACQCVHQHTTQLPEVVAKQTKTRRSRKSMRTGTDAVREVTTAKYQIDLAGWTNKSCQSPVGPPGWYHFPVLVHPFQSAPISGPAWLQVAPARIALLDQVTGDLMWSVPIHRINRLGLQRVDQLLLLDLVQDFGPNATMVLESPRFEAIAGRCTHYLEVAKGMGKSMPSAPMSAYHLDR